MDVMKKVLFIANYRANAGGISTQVDVLNKMLRLDGFETSIFSLKGGALFRLKAYFKLMEIGRDYEVFHIHACSGWGFLPAVIGVRAGKKLGKKTVLTYHGGSAESFFKKRSCLVNKYLKQTDTNIVLSGYLSDVFDRYDIPCVTIPNIIELKEGVFRKRSSIVPAFISIRSFTPTYNISCTLKAFQKVKRVYPEAVLTLLGDGPLRSEMETFVKEQKIEGVDFVGRVPNERIYEYLDRADIMLSSPVTDNMPMSLLEGFNAGLLVISSNVGGVPYMIRDGVNGLLFASDNSDEMAEKMMEAVEQQEKTIEMIQQAREGLKDYTWENNREKYFSIYQ